ncbi:MAG: hypothetical protein AB1458_11470 [Bacteroidota bacterium]
MHGTLRSAFKNFSVLFFYYSALLLVFYLASNGFGKTGLLTGSSLLNWDAQHYLKIAEHGYEDIYTSAFFPLFPLIWKLSALGPVGISILNGLLFMVSLAFAGAVWGWTTRLLLLSASVPSLIFMFLPYSEAVFFIASLAVLAGYHKNNTPLLCLGFMLCGMARPVTTVLIPAIIITELCSAGLTRPSFARMLLPVMFSLAGMAIALTYQYAFTGSFTSFFEAQKAWGNNPGWPEFPLTSWGGDKIVRLDGTALLAGFVAGLAFLFLCIKGRIRTLPREVLFSILYLSGIALLIFLIRGGSLFSLNRFVFATPFFLMALYYLVLRNEFSLKQVFIFFFMTFLFWLMLGSYKHIQVLGWFALTSGFLSLFLLIGSGRPALSRAAFILCLALNSGLQVYFFYRFLNGQWVA